MLAFESGQSVTELAHMLGLDNDLLLFDMLELFYEEEPDEEGSKQYGWKHTRQINVNEFLFGGKKFN